MCIDDDKNTGQEMKKIFIGGSRSITKLNTGIVERLQNIISEDYKVLCGDASGADKAVQRFFCEAGYRKLTIYYSGDDCRMNLGEWSTKPILVHPTIKGLHFYMVKDQAMANDADKGFMIWDGKSVGSISNVFELLRHSKKSLVYFAPTGQFWPVSDGASVQSLLEKCDETVLAALDKKIKLKSTIRALQGDIQFALNLS